MSGDAPTLTRLAPAKVNLYLHVAAPDAKGYHPLQSLVMFADIGDAVSILETDGSADNISSNISISGRFGDGLSGGEDNLIGKAIRAFEAATGVAVDRHVFALDKALPVASGLGGGSADAGATLHLLRELYAPGLSDETLGAIAAQTGADGVMCLWAKTAIAEGYGELLTPLKLPSVAAVLVNPGVACPTGAVYQGYDRQGVFEPIDVAGRFRGLTSQTALIEALTYTRNDLQAPAIALQPVIAEVLSALDAQPETLLARMSGSGATCFALCADDAAAGALSRRLEGMMPAGWVTACRLGG